MLQSRDQGFQGDVFNWLNEGQPVEIMQFTGLHDKNGVEIYEGDVVKCMFSFDGATLPHIGVVVYVGEIASFATRNNAGNTPIMRHSLNTMVVVGNVHENPELLGPNHGA